MRLVAWNCAMALHMKFAALDTLQGDISIISECANLDRLRRKSSLFVPSEAKWAGANPNKGLGVFAANGLQLRQHPSYDPALSIALPIEVRGKVHFNLLAIWLLPDRKDPTRHKRPGLITTALDAYDAFCREAPLVVAGDFNNNVYWDAPGKMTSHALSVEALAARGLVSAYHHSRGLPQGNEPEPTHYWRDRKKDRGRYHIDYAFLPRAWADRLTEVTVGSYEQWCGNGLSDHVPLVVDVELGDRHDG